MLSNKSGTNNRTFTSAVMYLYLLDYFQYGADHGADSFKMWISPLVTAQPDKYTFCFLVFKAEENRHNVGVAMELLTAEIHALEESKWK